MATSIDQKNFVKTALRLPPELHAAVHEAAQKKGRSYNAELVERIQDSMNVGATHDLLIDQAHQIWHLRNKVMDATFAMRGALEVLRGREDEKDVAIAALEKAIAKTAEDARSFLEDLLNDYVGRTGEKDLSFLKTFLEGKPAPKTKR